MVFKKLFNKIFKSNEDKTKNFQNLSNNIQNTNNNVQYINQHQNIKNVNNIPSFTKKSTIKTIEEIKDKKLYITNINANEIKTSGKRKYNYNSKELFVEDVALEYYKTEGFNGLYTENNYWWHIFAILFWDIIFMKTDTCTSVPMNHPRFNQEYELNLLFSGMPNDFFKETFYQTREKEIKERLEILKESNIKQEIEESYIKHFGTICRPIEDWNRYSLDELFIAPSYLENVQLLAIMERLIINFSENRAGLPDLIVFDDSNLYFIEAKSQQDYLTEKQINWHEYLIQNAKIDVILFTVNKSQKQIKNLLKKYNENLQRFTILTEVQEEKTVIDDLEITTRTINSNQDEIKILEKQYNNFISKEKIGPELKYTIVLYLNQIKKKPIDLSLWSTNHLDESYSKETIEEYVLKEQFITEANPEENLCNIMNSYTIPVLKEVLKENNLKVSGRKQELIDRLIENIDTNKLISKFNKSSYSLTEKGNELVNDNPQVFIFKKYLGKFINDYDIKEYEKLYQKNKSHKKLLEILIDYLKFEGERSIQKCYWFNYEFDTLEKIADIYFDNKNYEESLKYYIKVFIVDYSFWGMKCLDINNVFIRDYYLKKLLKTINILKKDSETLRKLFYHSYDTSKVPLLIIPKEDMYIYFLKTINGHSIEEIQEELNKRITVPEDIKYELYFNNQNGQQELVKKLKQYQIFN